MSNSGKAFDFNIFLRLYRKGKPYRVAFFITMALVLLLASIVGIRPAITRDILDDGVRENNQALIIRLSMWYIVVMILEALIQYVQTQLANRVAQSVTFDLRSELYRHVLKFKLNYYDKTPVGQFVTRLISDIDGVADVFSAGILDIVRDFLKLFFIVGMMLWLDWKMTLWILIPIPILFYATRIFQVAVKKSFNDVRNQVGRINVFIQEHVSGMNIVQIFNREKIEQDKFRKINIEHRDAHIRGIWAYSIFFPIVELLSAMSVALMIWWGLHESVDGRMTPGKLLEFSTFITMMYRPIRQMADNFNVLQMGVVNAERVFKLLDTPEQQVDEGKLKKIDQGGIEFRNVSFGYTPEQDVLHDISMEIRPGEMIAFVGATGSGKTTLAALINRFYDTDRGEILIDNQRIREYSLEALRGNIGLVSQDVFLLNDSIFNNITLYDDRISREEVVEASKKIGTHDFIMKLPGNYDYNVRERGGMLSTGQRQLISFIRAYVQNTKILILDEATSSVDTQTESLIQFATESITKDRTSIVIAHRLSTVRRANKIIVLHHGRIMETGTHETLLNANGIYKRLFELQFQDQ
ncbi:MAG: ABC transporter ATP-binding protein/permease [Flavobacteriales bacterium]|nr:ABC transporter ATP-binding protein/permease [Flavobacteriales bacterium]